MTKLSSDEQLKTYKDVATKLVELSGDKIRTTTDEKTGNVTRVDLPSDAYYGYLQGAGITKEVVKQLHTAHVNIAAGVQLIAAEHAVKAVEKSKADGLDPKETVAPMVVLPTADGQFEGRIKVYDTGRNPRTGEATETFGRSGLKLKLGSPMRSAVSDSIADTFAKLLGGCAD